MPIIQAGYQRPGYDFAAWRRQTLGRVGVAITLGLGECALVVFALIAGREVVRSEVGAAQVAFLLLCGADAAAGLPVAALAAWANGIAVRRTARPGAARRLAVVAQTVAVIRLVALVAAGLAIVVATLDTLAPTDACFTGYALLDALAGVALGARTLIGLGRRPAVGPPG